MIRCQLIRWRRDTARKGHHLGVLDQSARQPTSKTSLELRMGLDVPFPAMVAHQPSLGPQQHRPATTVLKVSDLPPATVMHLLARTPTVRAIGQLLDRTHPHYQLRGGVHHHTGHTDSRQVKPNRHKISTHLRPPRIRRFVITTYSNDASTPSQGPQPPLPTNSRSLDKVHASFSHVEARPISKRNYAGRRPDSRSR